MAARSSGVEFEEVLAVEQNLAARNLIVRLAGDDIGERRFAGAVRPHDGRDLAVRDGEVETVEDLLPSIRNGQVLDFEHSSNPSMWREARRRQPTLPSSEIAISFCASTANSIGNCCSTSRTKPLTISAVASSAESPRCMQ